MLYNSSTGRIIDYNIAILLLFYIFQTMEMREKNEKRG
jgi:hypothetical protein